METHKKTPSQVSACVAVLSYLKNVRPCSDLTLPPSHRILAVRNSVAPAVDWVLKMVTQQPAWASGENGAYTPRIGRNLYSA